MRNKARGQKIEKMRQAITCGMQAMNGAVYHLISQLTTEGSNHEWQMAVLSLRTLGLPN